jgi:hypothetical protein
MRPCNDGLLLSKNGLAALGVFIAVTGVTLSSIFYGALSIPYCGAVLMGLILTLPLFVNRSPRRSKMRMIAVLVATFPCLLYALQMLFLDTGRFEPELLPAIAIATVVLVVIAASLLPASRFQETMGYIAIAHILICMYGLANWNLPTVQVTESRLQVLNLGTAVWAEVGLGTLVAAVFSNSRLLICISTAIAALMIFATQMRGAGLAALVLVSVYVSLEMKKKASKGWALLITALLAIAIWLTFDRLMGIASELLLLDDPHRGINSGFSGRLDNWRLGVQKFLASPIIGAGTGDISPQVGVFSAHNGLIRMLAEFGVIFGVAFCMFFVLAFKRAWQCRSASLVAVLSAYAVFLGSAPRYLNLQIMPLLGVVAIGVAIIGNARSAASRTGDVSCKDSTERGF